MSYRINSHSTSDDDSKYRRAESPVEGFANERDYWEARSPIHRFGKHLGAKGWWTAEEEEVLRKECRKRAIKALNDAEQVGNPHPEHLFTDVYDELPWFLREQQAELKAHLQKYRSAYPELKDQEIDTL